MLETKIENALDQTQNPVWFSFEWLLYLLSKLYTLGVKTRVWLFEKKILPRKTLPCCVISIGNITVGGTGKTPMSMYLARALVKTGKKPVVISRGYKGNYTSQVLVVSDGDRVFAGPDESGDEPYMMAQQKICPVVVGKNRFKAGQKAVNEFNPDVIILDDGFQHISLKRDLDLLLFDYSNPLGNNRCLPSGRLRETAYMAAKRAHALIFTRCPSACQTRSLNDLSTQPPAEDVFKFNHTDKTLQPLSVYFNDLPGFKTCHVPFICEQIICGDTPEKIGMEMEHLKGKKAFLFSGIAKNSSFYRTMAQSGVIIVDHLEFKDHYRYKRSDFEKINKTACQKDVDIILTTEKDQVKLMDGVKWEKDLIVIGIQIQFQTPERFLSFLNEYSGLN